MPFGIPDDDNLSGMQAIFNHIYKALKSYTISIGSNCPVFGVVCYYYHVYTYDLLALIIMFSFILVASNLCNILASDGCTFVNLFFDANVELYLDDVLHKEHATEVLATLSFLFRDPKNGTGLFHSDLIISTLFYYGQIHGAIDVHDVCHSMYYCDEGPVGALSLATVSLDVEYTHMFADIYDG